MSFTLRLFAIPMIMTLAVGCDAAMPARKSQLNANGAERKAGIKLEDMKNYAGKTIPDRSSVSSFYLDEGTFRVDAFRVGLQAFMRSEAPQVSFNIPAEADYIELIRCQEEAKAISAVKNVDIGVGSNEAEVRIMRSTNFWKEVSESLGCLLVSGSVSGNTYLDMSAPSGSYRYLARACVNQSRLTDTDVLGNRNCTLQVVISTSLASYVNLRTRQENDALGRMQKAMSLADGLGRKIFFQTVEYNNALAHCERQNAANAKDQARFNAITAILGGGVSLGVSLLTQSPKGATVDQLWGQRSQMGQEASAFGGLLASTYVNPSEAQTGCNTAELIQSQAKLSALELRAAQQTYMQARDEAEQFTQSRQTLEK